MCMQSFTYVCIYVTMKNKEEEEGMGPGEELVLYMDSNIKAKAAIITNVDDCIISHYHLIILACGMHIEYYSLTSTFHITMSSSDIYASSSI